MQIGIKVGEKITMHESKHRLQALAVVRCPSLGTFTDYSDASGLRDIQAGFFAFGDVDNDGDQDVFSGTDYALTSSVTHVVCISLT